MTEKKYNLPRKLNAKQFWAYAVEFVPKNCVRCLQIVHDVVRHRTFPKLTENDFFHEWKVAASRRYTCG